MGNYTRRKGINKLHVKKMNVKGTHKAPRKNSRHRMTRRRKGGGDKLTKAQLKKKNSAPKAQEGYEKVFDKTIDNVKYQKIGDVEGPDTYSYTDAVNMRRDRTSPRDLLSLAGPRTPPPSPTDYGPGGTFYSSSPPQFTRDTASPPPPSPPASSLPVLPPPPVSAPPPPVSAPPAPVSAPPASGVYQRQDSQYSDAMDTSSGPDNSDGCGELRKIINSLQQEVLNKHQQFQSQDQHLRGLHERLNAQEAELHHFNSNNQQLQGQVGQLQGHNEQLQGQNQELLSVIQGHQQYADQLQAQIDQGSTAGCGQYIGALTQILRHLTQNGSLTLDQYNQMEGFVKVVRPTITI